MVGRERERGEREERERERGGQRRSEEVVVEVVEVVEEKTNSKKEKTIARSLVRRCAFLSLNRNSPLRPFHSKFDAPEL